MKRTLTRLNALLALSATVLCASACGSGVSTQSPPAMAAIAVVNCGQQLQLAAPPQRIVGLAPTQTELLIRLGARDRLVAQAQTSASPLPPEIAEQAHGLTSLSTDTPPGREALLAVQPDLVVAATAYEYSAEQGYASIDQLRENGVAAYTATGGCPQRRRTAQVGDLLTDLDNLGRLIGAPERANELRVQLNHRLDRVRAQVASRPRQRVAQLYLEGNSISASAAGVEADIVASAGGDNVFSSSEPAFAKFLAATVSPEEIIKRDPEVIVFGYSDAEHERRTRDRLTQTFPDISAVRTGRMVGVPASDLLPGAWGNVAAVEQVAARLHPAG